MTREQLETAGEHVRAAAQAASDADARERLYRQAEEFERHAEAERGPDHGRLARHERILDDVATAEGGEVREEVDAALDHVHAYRETLPGV
ncbi:DUF7553 family protein [Haloarchaeobius salinus]|uniref:DUF7553 family protein n=1 Tax=Haloarchaeobius salinus TaxID=1198298 RepID=UPI002109A0B4|nr:hypothetical protein [Haloarchaeobius salinus]